MNQNFLTVPELAQVLGRSLRTVLDMLPQEDLIRGPGGRKGIPPRLVRERLQENGSDYAFRVLAHVNLRGGVGKTVSTISLAVRAAQYGFLTCVLDLDPQGSSSLAFDRIPEEEDPIFYDVWKNPSTRWLGRTETGEGTALPSPLLAWTTASWIRLLPIPPPRKTR